MSFSDQFFQPRRGLAAIAIILALTLSACGGGQGDGSADPLDPSASATDGAAGKAEEIPPSDNLDDITVEGDDVPELDIPAPWAVDKVRTKVLEKGGSQLLSADSTATVDYAGYNARTGEVFDSSWDRGTPVPFQLHSVVPGFRDGLEGQAVGSRVLIAIPSEEGYSEGNPEAGIEIGDTIVFVVDILSANYDEATGKAVEPDPDLPTVKMTDDGPELSKPEGKAPKKLVAQPLIEGDGEKVAEESAIQVQYRSWVWKGGKLWDDAWMPQQGRLNTLIKGWQEGLVGQKAGSRILLVVPPELAYPNGDPDMGLDAGETLVYVIDILDVNEEI